MAIEVVMPKWGLTMSKGKITRWLKDEGERVKKGEPLFEVETEKITNVVAAPADGILFQIVVAAGQTVPVQTVVAVLAAPGEEPERREFSLPAPEAAGKLPAKEAKEAAAEVATFVRATPIARRLARQWGIDLAAVPGSGPGGRVTEDDVNRFREQLQSSPEASPQARDLARRAGIDLSRLRGSGKGGRITKADVLRAIRARHEGEKTGEPPPGKAMRGQVLPFEGMRKTIADNMMASLHQSAQLSVFVEIDATELQAWRDRWRQIFGSQNDIRISYTDIIGFAVCRALQRHPIMNSWLTEEGIRVHEHVNLGIAVALTDGLIVPNVKRAEEKTLLELAVEIRELAAKARQGRLSIDEVQGGTFTITNVSMLGVDGFTPILNPPETAILGVGRTVDKAAVHRGRICIRTMMTLSLTWDHRVADGVPAMNFLRHLADLLETPALLIA